MSNMTCYCTQNLHILLVMLDFVCRGRCRLVLQALGAGKEFYMTAKVTFDFGDYQYAIPASKAPELYGGVIDAFSALGMQKSSRPIDFVEVVQILPSIGGCTQKGDVVIRVVVSWGGHKLSDSFGLNVFGCGDIQGTVSAGVLKLVKALADRVFLGTQNIYNEFVSRRVKL
jgi:hypothetical protein